MRAWSLFVVPLNDAFCFESNERTIRAPKLRGVDVGVRRTRITDWIGLNHVRCCIQQAIGSSTIDTCHGTLQMPIIGHRWKIDTRESD